MDFREILVCECDADGEPMTESGAWLAYDPRRESYLGARQFRREMGEYYVRNLVERLEAAGEQVPRRVVVAVYHDSRVGVLRRKGRPSKNAGSDYTKLDVAITQVYEFESSEAKQ